VANRIRQGFVQGAFRGINVIGGPSAFGNQVGGESAVNFGKDVV